MLTTDEMSFDPGLQARLKRMRLHIEVPDQDTLSVKRVPVNHGNFSKAKTNILIKRSTEGMPCFVCVDEDLEYTGADQALTHAFTASPTQQGWRVLTFGGRLRGDLNCALEYALDFLGAGKQCGNSYESTKPPRKGLLTCWAKSLVDSGGGHNHLTLFRDEEIEQIAACTLGFHCRLPLIVGEAGIGKSNLLLGIARVLASRELDVVVVNMGALMAGTLLESEREELLQSLLRETRESGVVLAIEQAEWAVAGVPHSLVLLRHALDEGTRLIATSSPEHSYRFMTHPLGSRLEIVQLEELCASDTLSILKELNASISAHHGVAIDAEVESAVVERSLTMEGSLPGKAVRVLDIASARASLTGSPAVSLIDVYVTASRMLEADAVSKS